MIRQLTVLAPFRYSQAGMQRSLARQLGLTMLEIVVALAVGLILLIGIIQLLINTNQAFRVQNALQRVQENGQFAIQYLAQDIRNTDFWGCLEDTSWIVNRINTSGTGYNITYYGFTKGLEGTANQATGGSIVAGTDTITVRSATPVSGLNQIIAPFASSTASPITINANSNLNSGSIVLVSDCQQGDIFQVTNGSASGGTLEHASGVGAPGNATSTLSKIYSSDAFVYLPYTNIYSIQLGTSGLPSLFVTTATNSQELVEGVERMLILYGEDTDGDGAANKYVQANQVGNMDNVVSVRVNLVIESLEDNLLSRPQSYVFNNQTITPTDYRLRRVYTTTINLRNRQF
jgi:type IV pilus assembly protein PilW